MSIDAHVPGRASERLVLPVWYVLARLGIDVLLREAEVDDMDCILLFGVLTTQQKVFRLNVAINKMFGMYKLDSVELIKNK